MKSALINKNLFVFVLAIFIFTTLVSCNDDDKALPTIEFVSGAGLVTGDVTIGEGVLVTVRIKATWNGSDYLSATETLLNEVSFPGGSIMETVFESDFKIRKTDRDVDIIKIIVRDEAGQEASISFKMFLDPNAQTFGLINSYTSKILGAQNNSIGSFLSFTNASVYNLNLAFAIQSNIDFLSYFSQTEGSVITSPAGVENGIFAGEQAPENWSIKNSTNFCPTTLTNVQFESMTNDELIIASYNQASAIQRAINLNVGDIYTFKTNTDVAESPSKLGVFMVVDKNEGEDGFIELKIKIQSEAN